MKKGLLTKYAICTTLPKAGLFFCASSKNSKKRVNIIDLLVNASYNITQRGGECDAFFKEYGVTILSVLAASVVCNVLLELL